MMSMIAVFIAVYAKLDFDQYRWTQPLFTRDAADVNVEKSRAQAYASMPASYIANFIYCTIANF